MRDVSGLVARFPRERTWLLPALEEVQRAEHWLSPEALEAVAAHVRVPRSEVWGVASHYAELRLTRPGRRLVRVCTGVSCRVRGGRELLAACAERLGVGVGSCGLAVGAAETFAALGAEVERRKLPAAVVAAGCNGMCWAAPVVEVVREGRPRLTAGPVAASDVGAFLDALVRENIPA